MTWQGKPDTVSKQPLRHLSLVRTPLAGHRLSKPVEGIKTSYVYFKDILLVVETVLGLYDQLSPLSHQSDHVGVNRNPPIQGGPFITRGTRLLRPEIGWNEIDLALNNPNFVNLMSITCNLRPFRHPSRSPMPLENSIAQRMNPALLLPLTQSYPFVELIFYSMPTVSGSHEM